MTKIFYGNQYIEKFNCDGKKYTKWQVLKYRITKFLKKLFITTAIVASVVGIAYGSFKAGATLSPVTVFADKIVNVPVTPVSPVLIRIEKCESDDMQNNSQGQTLIHVNSNGSYDQGEYQINSTWNTEATKLGYNLSTADGNQNMAQYLYENVGTSPWSSSSKCWSK